jgi:superfamily II DNA or RNA helicase
MLELQMGTRFLKRRIGKETKNIDFILQQFEQKKFQFLLAFSGAISHGIDLAFVNHLIFMEPQFLATNQKQTAGRLPRLGKNNPDQTIISPYYENTPDDTLYESHLQLDEMVPQLE